MPPRRTTITTPLLWSAGALVGLLVLRELGRGDPRFEVPSEPTAWPAWWSAHDPLDVAAALGRWLALGLIGYLAVVSLLHLAAALAPRGRVRRVARATTPRFLTGLLAGAVVVAGTSSVGASAPSGTSATSVDGSNPPVMRVIDTPSAPVATSTPPTTSMSPPTTSMPPPSTLPPQPTPTAPAIPLPADATTPPAAASTEPSATPGDVDEIVVAPGDHLWAIAEHTVAERLGTEPDDTTIADYWRRLIDANRDRLSDPSLIFPGQRLVLPV